MPTPPSAGRPPAFRPQITTTVLYIALFFFFFAMVLILPEMLEALEQLPPDADPELAGREVAQRVAGPRLLAAFLLAVISLGVGGYYQLLPGLRRP